MAKLKGQLFGLSGKMGDQVYVQRQGHEGYVRRRPKPGLKKNEPALKQNYTRTGKLNNLASAINSIVKMESGGHTHGKFYFELLKRFRKQTSNNRFLMLSTLIGMDIHPRYTLGNLGGDQKIFVKPGREKINVTLKVKSHPKELANTNCYCYEVLLLTWKKGAKTPKYCRQLSDWSYLDKPTSEFEFSFEKQDDTLHWMLCLKQDMGFNEKTVSLKLGGMRIVEVGTFDKKDIALQKKNAEDEKKRKPSAKKEDVKIVRVKPKEAS